MRIQYENGSKQELFSGSYSISVSYLKLSSLFSIVGRSLVETRKKFQRKNRQ